MPREQSPEAPSAGGATPTCGQSPWGGLPVGPAACRSPGSRVGLSELRLAAELWVVQGSLGLRSQEAR